MTSINYSSALGGISTHVVGEIPFQELEVAATGSLSWPRASAPEGEALRLLVAGRLLMASDAAELGPISEDVRTDVRQQWPD